MGSYIDGSLRDTTETILDDWRATQTIAGTRTESQLNFPTDSFGALADVGLAAGPNGSDENWDSFSVQWDGQLTITRPNTHLYLRSDDGARLLVDVSQDHILSPLDQLAGGFLDNHYGSPNPGVSSQYVVLQPGSYDFRVQYEEGNGSNNFQLLWDDGYNLTPGSEMQVFRLAGQAGQHLYFDNLGVYPNSYSANWILYDGGNQSVFNQYVGYDVERTLTSTGEYLLVFAGSDATHDVSFGFQVTTPETTTQSLTLDVDTLGTLPVAGDQAVFTFAGTAGQKIFYDAFPGFDSIQATLVSPLGTAVFSHGASQEDNVRMLTETGEYRLVFDGGGDFVGDFHFRLLNAVAAPVLPLDTFVSGQLDSGWHSQLYRFASTAGARLYFDQQGEVNYGLGWSLYDQNALSVARSSYYYFTDGEVTIPRDGEYVLLVQGFADSGPIPYYFQLDTPTTNTTALDFGTAYGGSLAVTESVLGLSQPVNVVFGPDGKLYVGAEGGGGGVFRFDGTTGAFIDEFIPRGADSINSVWGIAFDTNGDLYVAERDQARVVKFSGVDGSSLGDFVTAGDGGLGSIRGMTFGPDGNLYLADFSSDRIIQYSGTDGRYLGDFVTSGDGGLDGPNSPVFGPDGKLYVSSYLSHAVLRFNGTTGAFIDELVPAQRGGLRNPVGFVFLPGSDLLVSSFGTSQVKRFDGTTGDYLGEFIDNYSTSPTGLALGGDGHLYVAARNSNQVRRYDGTTGSCIATTVICEAGEQDTFTFTGAAGQSIFYDALQADHDGVTVKIIDPLNNVIHQANADSDGGPFILKFSGQYRIQFTGDDGGVGDYRFQVLDAASATSVTVGTPVIGQIDNGRETLLYKFSGIAGQRVTLTSDSTSRTEASWWLLGTTMDNFAGTRTIANDFDDIFLSRSGDYTLVVSGEFDDLGTLDFTLSITDNSEPTVTPWDLMSYDRGI